VNVARDEVLAIYDEPDNSSDSAGTTSYCDPESRSRKLPPIPDGRGVGGEGGTTKSNKSSGVTSDELQSDSGVFLSIGSSEAEVASYSGLSSTTREPLPPPQVYHELTKPDYYNVNGADNAMNSDDVICEKPQSDSGIVSNDRSWSEGETAV